MLITQTRIGFAWRGLLSLFVVLSFALQSQITQTHVHFSPDELRTISSIADNKVPAAATSKTDQKKQPTDDDPVHCPLCQMVASTGTFLTPFVPALLVSLAFVDFALLSHNAASHSAAKLAHDWWGRGPPAL